jgi:hypothetical protein
MPKLQVRKAMKFRSRIESWFIDESTLSKSFDSQFDVASFMTNRHEIFGSRNCRDEADSRQQRGELRI